MGIKNLGRPDDGLLPTEGFDVMPEAIMSSMALPPSAPLPPTSSMSPSTTPIDCVKPSWRPSANARPALALPPVLKALWNFPGFGGGEAPTGTAGGGLLPSW